MGILAVGQALAQDQPPRLSLMQEHESVYAPPEPERPEEGVNEGGVHFGLEVRYVTDYVYRGVEMFDDAGDHEDSPNFQIDGLLSWDLGKLPHPFVGVFVNVYESDPVSNFQEIRPYVGLDWNLRPLILTGGQISYLYPDRDDMNTGEVYGQIKLDDSYFFKTDKPFLSPYIYGAYDYDLYLGWYFEAGVSHEFEIEDWGIVLRLEAEVAYVLNNQFFTAKDDVDTGFQHYQIGLIGEYSLNSLLNLSKRYGEWHINGYLYYTDGIDNDLEADTQIWGGAGIGFQY
jgi:hypothetical protein